MMHNLMDLDGLLSVEIRGNHNVPTIQKTPENNNQNDGENSDNSNTREGYRPHTNGESSKHQQRVLYDNIQIIGKRESTFTTTYKELSDIRDSRSTIILETLRRRFGLNF